jgi:hypothetical protein
MPLAIEAAAKNRVFNTLDSNGAARKTDTSQRGLHALLDMLVSIELLEKRGGATYALTPESLSRQHEPSFQGGIFKDISSQLVTKWMKLGEIVRSGRPERAVNAGAEAARSLSSSPRTSCR